jgi:hypothetical protein
MSGHAAGKDIERLPPPSMRRTPAPRGGGSWHGATVRNILVREMGVEGGKPNSTPERQTDHASQIETSLGVAKSDKRAIFHADYAGFQNYWPASQLDQTESRNASWPSVVR